MRRRSSLVAVAVAAVAVLVPSAFAAHRGARPAVYLVGGATESINPTQAMLDGHDFFLGGYGFSSGRPGNAVDVPQLSSAIGDRYATGILGDGVHTRALAVSDGTRTVVLSQIETQGYFAAYKQGPFGIVAIRKDAAARIKALAAGSEQQAPGAGSARAAARRDRPGPPVPSAEQIVVDSDHSHGGPDTVGVWGGVPTSYLKLVHDRTVDAIVEAWQAMRPATLSYGVAHAGVNGEAQYPPSNGSDPLLSNQFADDPANQVMDDEVRVLQARDPETGDVLDTYVNFSGHPTVLGGDNRLVTADYVGRLDLAIAREFGGFAMDQVATLGRTQPTDRGCSTATADTPSATKDLCALDEYAARVLAEVRIAADAAEPFTGAPQVAMNSYLLSDTTTSPVLAGLVYAGQVVGAPAGRAANPPWYTGTQVATSYFVGRIGSVLVTGGPGEMYPQIFQKVRDAVGTGHGITGFMNIGTAGDFLGYIIAPLEAYPQPMKRSVLSGDNTPDPIGNDNYFFNISPTLGERLTCDFLRGAGDVLTGDPQTYWSTYDRCPAFATDLLLPPGEDTSFPEQPDLSAELTHM